MKRIQLLPTIVLVALSTGTVHASEIDGFTEPSRDLDLAAADTGLIASVDVVEGQRVTAGQVLARLNQDVLNASRRIVDLQLAAEGKMKSAEADLRLKTERVRKLKELLARRHAVQEEVDRADIEREVASAALEIVHEEKAVRGVERDRIDLQLERQLVRSPIDGVVVKTFKDVGEFVSPADPVVVRVVQLNPLRATFNVPESAVGESLTAGGTAAVRITRLNKTVDAAIEFISPTVESGSGTIRVTVKIDNSQGVIRAGEACALVTDGEVSKVATSQQ